MNEVENKKLMLQLKNRIDMRMYSFLKYDLDLCMWEEKEYFGFCNKSRNIQYSKNIDFNFKIFYEDSYDIYKRNYKKLDINSLTDEEFNKRDEELSNNAEKESDLNYVAIYWLGVNPQGQGVGSELMKVFIEEVKKIEKIKVIFLYPQDDKARKFWSKVGFVDYKDHDKKINVIGVNRMYLDLQSYTCNNKIVDETLVLN